MKFVTVMDMWILIINLGLLGCIVYFGRKLIKAVEKSVNRDSDAVREERDWIVKSLVKEKESVIHQMAMLDPKSMDWQHLNDQRHFIEELEARVMKRQR